MNSVQFHLVCWCLTNILDGFYFCVYVSFNVSIAQFQIILRIFLWIVYLSLSNAFSFVFNQKLKLWESLFVWCDFVYHHLFTIRHSKQQPSNKFRLSFTAFLVVLCICSGSARTVVCTVCTHWFRRGHFSCHYIIGEQWNYEHVLALVWSWFRYIIIAILMNTSYFQTTNSAPISPVNFYHNDQILWNMQGMICNTGWKQTLSIIISYCISSLNSVVAWKYQRLCYWMHSTQLDVYRN